jgi:DNA mismatch repair ATPase MutS
VKVGLLYADRDFDREAEPPPQAPALVQDLELTTLVSAMAAGDEYHAETSQQALLQSLTSVEAVRYRQETLRDATANEEAVRAMYDLAVEALVGERKIRLGLFLQSPDSILSRSVQVLEFFVPLLKRLRSLAESNEDAFASAAFKRLFAELQHELDDAYFDEIDEHLHTLRFNLGILASAELGRGNKGIRYLLRRPHQRSWRERLTLRSRGFTFQIPDRDEAGAQALAELRGRALNPVANAVAQSAEHITSFLGQLRSELSFLLASLNLREKLLALELPVAVPEPRPLEERTLVARSLCDPTLALTRGAAVVGNDVDGDGDRLIVVTGANQGGKSTFLRSVGVAQLMMQAGMFVAADSLRANLAAAVFTHYKREEDASLESGKLDEELLRMSRVAELLVPHALLLSNESFSATNEREGSQIAREIIRALLEHHVKVVAVTHLYDLAHSIAKLRRDDILLLRAERRDDGSRTFRLVEGEPLPTSFGADLYQRIFGRELLPLEESRA